MSRGKAGLGGVGLDLDFDEDLEIDDEQLLARPSKAPTAPPAAKSEPAAPATPSIGIQLVPNERRVNLPVYYDKEARTLLLQAVKTKGQTKGEVVSHALDQVLEELESAHNDGKPFPRAQRLKTGVVPPAPSGRERVQVRDGFWVDESVRDRLRNTVGALQRQGYRVTVGYLVEQALERHVTRR